jgi:hypothetical protein
VSSGAELWLRGDDQDEDDAEHGPGANSTAMPRCRTRSMPIRPGTAPPGPSVAGTQWVHAVPAGRGMQRAPVVTTGPKEPQVRPQRGRHQAALQEAGQSSSLPTHAVMILGGSPLFASVELPALRPRAAWQSAHISTVKRPSTVLKGPAVEPQKEQRSAISLRSN